jgi:transposase
MKECPLCGETMKLEVRQIQDRPERGSTVRVVREWVCPGCDYFEDADTSEG